MQNEKKQRAREIAHWLRIGSLTLSTLGPLINSIAMRVRERALQEERRQEEARHHRLSVKLDHAQAPAEPFWPERGAGREQTRRDTNNQLVSLGFAIGLTAASLAAFFFIRKKFQPQQAEDETIQLTNYEHLQVSQEQPVRHIHSRHTGPVGTVAPAAALTMEGETVHIPTNAKLLGVISTKRYYPLPTPPDELDITVNEDVIYFASEGEAHVHGFTRA